MVGPRWVLPFVVGVWVVELVGTAISQRYNC
jgi:hypothetical protein